MWESLHWADQLPIRRASHVEVPMFTLEGKSRVPPVVFPFLNLRRALTVFACSAAPANPAQTKTTSAPHRLPICQAFDFCAFGFWGLLGAFCGEMKRTAPNGFEFPDQMRVPVRWEPSLPKKGGREGPSNPPAANWSSSLSRASREDGKQGT